jgi:hypothetical protein
MLISLLKVLLSFFQITTVLASPLPSINIDFGNQTAVGSPLIFGGTQVPDDPLAVNLETNSAGMTFSRQDFFFESFVPKSTVENYKNNIGNIKDINTWDVGSMDYIANGMKRAKSNNMNLMAIIDYAPSWLTYSGTQYGVPKDWTIWQDIVEKTITQFKNKNSVNIDYYEIWNEPGIYFLDTTGSGMTSDQAYIEIYYYTWQAIKAVDPNAKIGGPAQYQPLAASLTLDAMLQDNRIKDKIDFVSYHFYDDLHSYLVGTNPSSNLIKNILLKYNKTNIPIILSEYNASCCGRGRLYDASKAPAYFANKFVELLDNGLLAAAMYNARGSCDIQGGCFYQSINAGPVLRAESSVFRLASIDLGIGSGPSKIFSNTTSEPLKSVAGINSSGNYFVMAVNENQDATSSSVLISNMNFNGQAKLDYYIAGPGNDAISIENTQNQQIVNSSLSFNLSIPAWSAVGIKISKIQINGDANGDGKVDGIDYVIWLSNYNQNKLGPQFGDFNNDGKVDGIDYVIWLNNYKL